MRLVLACVGRLKAGPERDLFERYRSRALALARSAGVSGLDVIEVDEGRGRSSAERKREEAASLGAKIVAGVYVVLLDERGGAMTSEAFAAMIGRSRDAGRSGVALLVGGADGLDEGLRARADLTMAFGAATLPHQIVRVLVAEQIYRAFTILTGHPYHRA